MKVICRLKRHFTLELCNLGRFVSRNFKLILFERQAHKREDEEEKLGINVNDVKS